MSKTLVAYFTAEGGRTGALAGKMAAAVGADLVEIVPKKPYTAADLNWNNPLARCNREQLAKKSVPVATVIDNMADYDTVLIGFPIWYYNAPMVIKTFVQDYDFSGKKLALFATSGGSDIGKTAEKLQPFLKGDASIADAQVFNNDPSAADLKAWVESL